MFRPIVHKLCLVLELCSALHWETKSTMANMLKWHKAQSSASPRQRDGHGPWSLVREQRERQGRQDMRTQLQRSAGNRALWLLSPCWRLLDSHGCHALALERHVIQWPHAGITWENAQTIHEQKFHRPSTMIFLSLENLFPMHVFGFVPWC